MSTSSVGSAHSQERNKPHNRKNHDKDHLSIPSGAESVHSFTSNNSTTSRLLSSLHPIHNTYGNNPNIYASLSFPHYLQRMTDIQQMDTQSALDQMFTLCTLHPQRVYKTSYYRKQTKNHWARDDPAFAVLQIAFLFAASIAYCIAFRDNLTFSGVWLFALRNIVLNWAGFGVIMATLGRALANHYLTVHNQTNGGNSLHVKQSVEWLYAFDIHCNAFFPLFVLLYALQFFLLPLVLGNSLLSLILSNTLYALAFSWYFYITHLGYRALPFLSNTEVFLFPIVAVLVIYVLNFVGYPMGLGWNASRLVAHFYFD